MRTPGSCVFILLATMAQILTILSIFGLTYIYQIYVSHGQVLGDVPETYDELYNSGIDSYTSEDWLATIESLEKAIAEFKFYRSSLVTCRLKCNNISNQFDGDLEQYEDLQFFDRVLRKAECLVRCKDEQLGTRPERISDEVTSDFMRNVPYSYLQMAYYKTDQMEKAASAAYTFLLANPGDEMMESNMLWYHANSGLEDLNLQNLEAKSYQVNYLKGRDFYEKEEWTESIAHFELGLEEFYIADSECRTLCEGPHEHKEFQDLYLSISTHYHSVLTCKLGCFRLVSVLEGKFADDYIPSHYHHLQYAYFQVGELSKAIECAVSYLLFEPNDEVMAQNMMFYEKQDGVTGESFRPGEDAQRYYNRVMAEARMKKFADGFISHEGDAQGADNLQNDGPIPIVQERRKKGDRDEEISDDSEQEENIDTGKAKYFSNNDEIQEDGNGDVQSNMENVTIVMTEKELNGTLRMVADGFATELQCEQLIELATAGAEAGDGYSGKEKPHSVHEKFSGLSVLSAAKKAEKGDVKAKDALLYLNLSEEARRYVESYYKLPSRLFFSYTHLVCREAEPDSPEERDDLSHPIHADNCWLDEDGNCIKKSPAYVWRDYSAIMYLNEDFEGGEFIFARFNKTVEASVSPKCGRLVSFSAGKENLHGVKAVTKGRRCALAMWYTLDTKYDEKDHIQARQILEQLEHGEL